MNTSVDAADGEAAPPPTLPYADGLCFMADDRHIEASGLSAFICDVTADEHGSVVRTFEGCAVAAARLRRRLVGDGRAFLATRGDDVRTAFDTGRTAVVMQMQGCDVLGTDLDRMLVFHALGVRVLQLTHHFDNAFGGGCLEARPSGLTPLGHEAVACMNELGIVLDLAHACEQTALEAIAASHRPVIVSHTGPQALVANARCASDAVLRAVARSGGVVGLFMMSFWVTNEPEPTVDAWVRSLRHMVDVAGIDHVGIANDFPLCGERRAAAAGNDNATAVLPYLPWWEKHAVRGIHGFAARPRHVVFPELNHVRRMFVLHDALARAGFRPSEVERLMGGNWIRLLADELG